MPLVWVSISSPAVKICCRRAFSAVMSLAGVFEDSQFGAARETPIGQDLAPERRAQIADRARRFKDGSLPADHEGHWFNTVHFAAIVVFVFGERN
jgi:hypothetical protein